MRVAMQGDCGTHHGQPQEQHAGEFVSNDEWFVEDVASDHPGEQQNDLDSDQCRSGQRNQPAEQLVNAGERTRDAAGWTGTVIEQW